MSTAAASESSFRFNSRREKCDGKPPSSCPLSLNVTQQTLDLKGLKNHKLKVVPSFGNVLLSLFREEDALDQDRCNAVCTCPELGSPMPSPLAELIPPPGVFWSDLEGGEKIK